MLHSNSGHSPKQIDSYKVVFIIASITITTINATLELPPHWKSGCHIYYNGNWPLIQEIQYFIHQIPNLLEL